MLYGQVKHIKAVLLRYTQCLSVFCVVLYEIKDHVMCLKLYDNIRFYGKFIFFACLLCLYL